MSTFPSIKNVIPNQFIAAAWMTMLILMGWTAPAHAYPNGVGSDHCDSCHNAAVGALKVDVTANGQATALTLRQGDPLTLTLKHTGAKSPSTRAGFSSGIYLGGNGNPIPPLLAATVSVAKITGGYLTHTSSATPNPITVSYTIPPTMAAGTYTIKSLMLAAEGGTGPSDDEWNTGNDITLTVTTAAGAPGTPINVTATAGNLQAIVAFALPGGSPAASSYTASCGPSTAPPGPASPLTVPNLSNGVPVTCTVTATNAAGTSAPSAPSNSVTPNNRPAAPTIGPATAGNGQVNVSFTAPGNTGGSAISVYTATCGSQTASGAASPLTVRNLVNGTPYTCSVTATNAAGAVSPASAPSNSVTPAGPPGAPVIGMPIAGNGQVGVAFTPSGSNGAPISAYTATCLDIFSATNRTVSGAASPLTVMGLTNGSAQSCSVTATNSVGISDPSDQVYITPLGPPGAPTIGLATAYDARVRVAFTAPASNGGAQVTAYTATCGDKTATGANIPIFVTGLTNGVPVTCTVTATNSLGAGPASLASNSVTPNGSVTVSLPGAPTIGPATAGNGQVSVFFTAPGNTGGAAITAYTATCGSRTASGPTSPLVVAGLPNGVPVTCSVTATNSAGVGPASLASNSVTPAAPTATFPDPPVIGTATPGNAQVNVFFTAPGSNGGSPITRYMAICGPPAQPGVPAAAPVYGPASPIPVVGLTNGTPYNCRAVAVNTVGNSMPSAYSNIVTPAAPTTTAAATVPGAPVIGTATAGNAQVSVFFTPPGSNGGSVITGYLASCSTTAGVTGGATTGTASPLIVQNLTNGTTYTCRVAARNVVGVGAVSAPSNSVTPFNPQATRGTATADIVFTSPPPTVNPSTVAPGGQVRLGPVTIFTMKNQGAAATGPFRFGVYLSTDSVITTADTFLNFASQEFNIAAGAEASFGNVNVTIPSGTAPGNYYIGMLLDDTNRVNESNENNNYVSAPITIRR